MNKLNIRFCYGHGKAMIIFHRDGHDEVRLDMERLKIVSGGEVKKNPVMSTYVALLNYILQKGYPYSIDKEYDVREAFKGVDHYTTAITNLNKYVLTEFKDENGNVIDDFSCLRIDKNTFKTTELINKEIISWTIEYTKVEDFPEKKGTNDLLIDESFESSSKQEEIDALIESNRNPTTSIKTGVYSVDEISEGPLWDDVKVNRSIFSYEKRIGEIDKSLLPKINVEGKDRDNLASYVCDEFINRADNDTNILIVEGDAGTGKTCSLYQTAMALSNNNYIALFAELFDVFSVNGSYSLIEHIRQFIKYEDRSVDTENLLRELIGNSDRKIVFLIDGIDEISFSRYRKLCLDLDAIASIDSHNIYFIFGTRNIQAFTNENGIISHLSWFNNWEHISLQRLSIDAIDDESLRRIIKRNKSLRTPLFVSYYKEVKRLKEYDLSSYSAVDVSSLGETDFDSYYDIFWAKTELLKAHAVKDNYQYFWYSAVLPYIAYYLHTTSENTLSLETLEKILETDNSVILEEDALTWFKKKLRQNIGFKTLKNQERLMGLTNTGLVRCAENEKIYKFEHVEYMQFLAARFAAMVVRDAENEVIKKKVLNDIIAKTTYRPAKGEKDVIDRIDRLRYMPMAHYMIIDLMGNNKLGLNQSDKEIDRIVFDTDLYRLAGNIAYEGIDIYDEVSGMTDELLKKYRSELISKEKSPIVFDKKTELWDEEWKVLEAMNVIYYEMITKRKDAENRSDILNYIYRVFLCCSVAMVKKAFLEYGKERKSFANVWTGDYIIRIIDELIREINDAKRVPDSWQGAPLDFISQLYSNIGAVNQEKGKYAFDSNLKLDGKKPEDFIVTAKEYHNITKLFRETLLENMSESNQSRISIIRSLITLGSDEYYMGLFSEEYETAKNHLELSYNTYFKEALMRQGVVVDDLFDFELFAYDQDVSCIIKEQVEIPTDDSKPHVICPRIAGAYYQLYEKSTMMHEKQRSTDLEEIIEDSVFKQYVFLRASYIFLINEIGIRNLNDDNHLELNRKWIDQLWKNTKKYYLKSLNYDESNREDILVLLNRILDLYKSLDKYTDMKEIVDTGADYSLIKQ